MLLRSCWVHTGGSIMNRRTIALIFILTAFVVSSCNPVGLTSRNDQKLMVLIRALLADVSGAPVAPSNLTATPASSSQINLSWTDNSTNETGFIIQQSQNNIDFTQIAAVSSNVTTYNNSGLAPSTTYYYRVLASNGFFNSEYSEDSATTDDPPASAPNDPSNLTATPVSSSQINLSWTDNSSDETGFKIQRSANNIDFVQIDTVLANITTYNNTGLSPSTPYYYRVYAYNAIDDSTGYCAASATTLSTTQIIADHSIVDDYDNIPAFYMAEVKKMMVHFPGESHSSGYRRGMELLEAQNASYACNVSTGEAYTDQYVRVNDWGCGEATWYTWYAYDAHNGGNVGIIKDLIDEYNSHGHPMHAIGFGWCWDTTWTNEPTTTKDPVYGCGWAGSSDGGPDGNLPWGLDAGDFSITNNRVSMDTYLGATEDYRLYCISQSYPTRVIFTTSPADVGDGADSENAYQRYLKHEHIRNYVAANSARILFDYSDILCHNDAGVEYTKSWSGHTYPEIHPDNMLDLDGFYEEDGDHIGERGAVRLAKAQWWLLARIAGWDGL